LFTSLTNSRFIWTHDVDVVSCITDPRCVAKEHYVPPEDAVDLSIGVPDEERGTIKLWQMQVVDYVRLLMMSEPQKHMDGNADKIVGSKADVHGEFRLLLGS
jgi:hypothetical protein